MRMITRKIFKIQIIKYSEFKIKAIVEEMEIGMILLSGGWRMLLLIIVNYIVEAVGPHVKTKFKTKNLGTAQNIWHEKLNFIQNFAISETPTNLY